MSINYADVSPVGFSNNMGGNPAKKSKLSGEGEVKQSAVKHLKIKLDESRSKLSQQQQRELEAVQARHKEEMAALNYTLSQELNGAMAAAQSSGGPCGSCGDVVQYGAFFVCSSCALPFCKAHLSYKTECGSCGKCYCEECMGTMDVCWNCRDSGKQLQCCQLIKEQCGEMACQNCSEYHFKIRNCRCNFKLPSGNMKEAEAGEQSTQVSIAKNLVGAIMGKGGSRIRKTRGDSGAGIKIADAADGNYRFITITGTEQQIHTAQQLLQQSVREHGGGNF